MNLTELLKNLSAKNVELWVEGDKLRYRGPENALSPELLASMKQYKSEILQILSHRSDRTATYPLSHGQRALWFLYQLAPKSSAYNITYAAKLVTNLEIPALKQAAQALVERHPVLRTTFTTIDGEPVQTVHKNQPVDLEVENAFALSPEDINNWLLQTSARPFNLEVGPLLRFRVLVNHTPTKEYILLITQHHIITDFWSSEIMLGELRVLYSAIARDREPLLPVQKCEYRDYVNWSEQMLSGSLGERLWNYWQQQLCGELPVLNLPSDRPRPQSQSHNGSDRFFTIEEKLRQSLTQLAKRERASLYMVLLTALQILLRRYSNQEDILIGSPTINRSRPEFEKILGYFTNPVVLRADLSGNPTFQELLGRSRLCVLDALEHQEYPFPLLVERLQPVRDPSISPLYQVAFAWDRPHQSDREESPMESDGLVVESIVTGAKGAAFDLTLSILHASDALKGTWNYNTDLFESSTIERMTGHYVTLLESIVANPTQRIDQLPLLTASEQQQLLVEWNDTQVDYSLDKCIHQLFEEQVERTPNAVAVVYENQQLTYEQLNSRANQLAHYLQSLGVGADVLVGICVERSLEMVVGLLGILKAGGAYVPLDPEYPTERLSFMLEDARVSVLLTQQQLVESLPQHQARVVCLDSDWLVICESSQESPIAGVQASNLAYAIYTSGSTGQPKGVMVSHSNLCNHMFWMQATFSLTEKDKVLQKTPFGFDASVWEFYAPLLVGGQLLIAQPGGHTDSAYLLKLITQQQVTTVQLVPSLLQMLLEQEGIETCHSLRQVFCGGEVLPITLQEGLLSKLNVNLYNLYGPTEACIDATFWNCLQQRYGQLVPIGRPIANTQIYILDRDLQPVPIGVPGELHIGGAGLARGYLNRPELTEEKFIPNPFNNSLVKSHSSKLYKTGDLARYRPDGNIEYLGRIDNQVKIRGFRIELGEIEAVLSQHEDVQACCAISRVRLAPRAIARVDTPGDQRLVAYIVPQPQVRPTLSVLRSFLSEKLPPYMVPNAIVILEALPLTPNGKVDRRALLTPDMGGELQEQYVAPRTPIEEILVQIWTQVLKVELIGVHDRFFELGGHSLLATQLVSRIRNIFKVELPLRSVFATPTVAELARLIQQRQQENVELTHTPVLPRAENAELPLSFAQQRLWFLDQLEPLSALYNIPFTLRLVGNLNVVALEQSLCEIIQRHEGLRTNFMTVNGQASQVIHTSPNWTVSIVDLQHLSTSEKEITSQQLARLQAIEPFDLATVALIRATLVVLSETEHVLNVCMHHIVSDGWSIGVLVSELAALYNAYAQEQPSPLVPLPIQYADFALWQRQWLLGDVLQSQLSYWLQQLANAPTFLPLPTDRPRGAVQTFNGAYQNFTLSVELTNKLTLLSQEQGVTLFMTLLASFKTLLYRYTGVADILVGLPIANRHHSEIESLIGFFVNTLVLRTDLSGNPSFNELLLRTRAMALSAYAHQDLPFEMLVEALQPERDLSHTPLFQVMFVLQNAPISQVELSGLEVSLLPIETATSKFDLTLGMENTATGLVGEWEYNTDLFDSRTIERMTGHLVTLLEAIVANPTERISQLPLLTQPEQQQLLVEWNDTQADYSQDKCIHQLFEEQVERTPNAVAVVFEDQQLTYQQLNSRVNQLAHYLHSLGVEADMLVGICVERSLEMVVGLLGILKAGGAYVPLDPDYPTDRLAYMLNDSQVSVLLTQEKCLTSLPEHTARVICLDRDWKDISTESKDNPVTGSTTDNLAYVIYTSGSTGQPKGTLVTHSNVVRLFAATDSWYHFNQDDVWTLFHSYAFDFSVWEIWGALLYGGRLVVVPYLVTRSPELFYKLLCQEQVTILNQTPSAFRQLIQAEQSIAKKSDLNLRLVIFGGEALEIKSLQPWFERHGDQLPQLVNMYGITETTVHVTYRPLSKTDLNGTASAIGRPIPDLQVYLLNEHLQPVPIGVTGEMYVGGAGVTRGYLNRPELTAQRFISNPFDNLKLLYKTGDLARYLPNGELEYLGRIDNQVKIRGFRIELGEIEALLASHPDIWESVVVLRSDETGDKRLVAYVVSKTEQFLSSAELRRFLINKLPSYMVPSAFVQLEALPLTANGKVDHRALPEPDTARPELENIFVAPITPEEKTLASIWANVLGVEQVGIYDNFFALGGDSIRSIQVLSGAKERGLSFSVQQLFQHQTIHELIQALKTQENGTTTIKLTQPFSLISEADKQQVPSGIEDAYPVAMLQMGMLYHSEYSQDSAIYHDIFSYHLKTSLNVQLLQVAIQNLVNHHPVLRTSFDLINFSIPLQLVHQQVEIPLQVEDWCHLNSSEQEDALNVWFEAEKKQYFDWTHAPLLRFFVHRRTEETFNLTVSFHHAILDGWSVASMMSELLKRYLSLCHEGAEYVSSQFSIVFRDFVALEQQAIASLKTQQYWSEKLNDSTFTKLPRWSSAPKNTNFREISVQEVTLSPEIFAGLKQLAQTAEVPLKNVLLAAHLRVLNFLSGQQDVVTGVVANGRPEQNDGERVLGLFLNTLPFRLQLSGGTWIDLVRAVFAAEREMLPHRRYPLAEIQKSLGGKSLFETAFNFTHFHVYEQVMGLDNLQLLGGKFFDQTNFTFLAQFSVSPKSSEIALNLEYDLCELCAEQINRISHYYHSVLLAMANAPQECYELHSPISLEERHQLLLEWNQTAVDYPQDKCLHQLFEEQVERTPDAVAVEFGNQQLTYYQLNCRANQLAHYLRSAKLSRSDSLGVGADVLVGICVERSLSMVIGLLGILKAGGAYVPLDPEYPNQRLSFMVEDARVQVLLTQHSLSTKFPQYQGRLICLDTEAELVSQFSQDNVFSGVQANHLGYVIYTSGSTGQPKGVAMSQRALCNLIFWHIENLKVSCGAKTLQFSPISFDASFHEMFSSWHSGGTLVLIPEELRRDAVALLGLMEDKAIERLFIPFVGLQQLAEVAVGNGLFTTHLREIITAGEQLQITPAISYWLSKLTHNCTLHNHYGPSESHVVTTFTLTNSVETWPLLPPIGRPIANTQIYILDEYLQPVPVGVPGELYIGGVALARGYLNRPELTQQRFIPNPFSTDPNSRLYKTGDLARYLPDGNIEFLGRIDNQVKIRGFRIELGEVEAVLSQHQDVEGCCVIAREDTPGDKRLVAYLVAHQNCTLTSSQLRQFLKAKLPEYMVPNAFTILESLPLTPSDKVDRRALPIPDLQSDRQEKYIAPRTPVEEMLALLWAQVLKVELVGIQDNFFTLGGQSLLATQLVSRIRNIFKVELPLRELFVRSTVSELAPLIEQLQQQDSTSAPPILPRAKNSNLPLSYAQQRLWFLDQLEPNSSSYNIPIALRLVGNLNRAALEQSLQKIIARHETLRTNFVTIDGTASQIIQTQTNWTLCVLDWQNMPKSEQEIATKKLVQQQAIQPFDLAKGILFRTTLVVLSNTEHILLACMHHVVSDAWSMGVFVEELAELYNADREGKPSPLLPLPIQYADFALWQRQWLQGNVLQNQLSYWQQQLADAPTFLPLPTDRSRGAVQTFNGAYLEFALSAELTSGLTKLSQEKGCTLFMTLLAAFKTLLYRYTGQSDILVGSPIANRHRSEIESLIGFFVNTLVLRTDLSGNPSFEELLLQTRSMALSAYAHQDLPFEMLVEALQPERNLSHTPLFQVMFVLQNTPISQVELSGLEVSLLPIETATAKFDLTLSMENTATGLVGGWEYNSDLFESSTIERMTQHYVTLLEAIVANPAHKIDQLPLLTASEQQQLFVEWNETYAEYPHDKCIHQLFEEQVARTPDAVAVVYEHQQLTYGELNCRANQLAHHLQSLGVRADVRVGICVERSLFMVVGLLGILKAGGAYVPLDPTYPTPRLSYMLANAGVEVLLTQQPLVSGLPQHGAVVCLDTDWHEIAQHGEQNPIANTTPDNLAYIIYTSGSTGQPKGAGVYHRGFVNLVNWLMNDFQLTSKDSTALISSLSFDLTQKNIFAPLAIGGKLHLLPDGFDPFVILNVIFQQRVSWVNCTPSTFYAILTSSHESFALTQSLRYVFLGGEAISIASLFSWLNSESCGAKIVNSYGPTECTDVCAAYLVQRVHEFCHKPVPIGKPLPNVKLHILDDNLQPVPVGVTGELCITGVGVGMGYVNDSERTAEKFIPNPFGESKLERLYKTGDLARYLRDGNIEYMGRRDNQVKIRGFRIELGEVETVLNAHPQVQQAAVIAREDVLGDKRLVAYLVPTDKSLTTQQLREFLKQKLPEYMVPNAMVILESLPLTPSGKVDRRALPTPDMGGELQEQYVAPRTPIEEILVQIWIQVLKVERIGVRDRFFTLGGHSLLATQLVSRIRNTFKVELPLRSVFATPTVAELALLIQQLQQENVEFTYAPILPRAENAELPLSYAQQRLWFLDQLEPLSPLYNIPFTLRLVGNLNVVALEQSFVEIIHRHEALRTNFITVDGKATQIVHNVLNWTVSIVDLQHLSATEKEITLQQLVRHQAIEPFDLSRAALLRATLVVLSETEHALLACIHHTVSDGWSIDVLVSELAALYNAYCEGKPSPLAPMSIQYADFAIWQRQWLQGDVLQSQLSYWLQQLANAPTFLPLPTDRPRSAVQTFNGAYLEFALSAELTSKLTKLSQEKGCTLFMALLAAFKTLLYRYTRQSDILVGSPIANRHHSEIEGLIGFFVNTLVLRTDLSGNPSFEELLLQTRSMALSAYAHQDLPFEMLVEALQLERDLSHTPLFQVMFVLQNTPISEVELSGLEVSLLPVEIATAKFDLTLSMENIATEFVGGWEYNSDLFDRSTIERMTGHFVTLLEAIVADPQQKIDQLPLLTATEQHQLLVEWNDTGVDYPHDRCIHQLFEEQVARTPDAIALSARFANAVVFEDQQLTYSELNCRANQLAHYLRSLGVGADVLVGLCVERSVDMIVGLLGILKAGGAYVPLDPEYPQERLSFMLEDTQVSLLVTQQRLVDRLPKHQAKQVLLDRITKEIVQNNQNNLINEVKAFHLANVIYTSGSTGKPKGVMVEHQGLCNLAQAQIQTFDLHSDSRVLQFASLSFDACIWEVLMAFGSGATLYLGAKESLMPGMPLIQRLRADRITHITLPPSALGVLPLEKLPALQTLIIAGEACAVELMQQWSAVTNFFNAYGPTEGSVCTTIAKCTPFDQKISIGRPIANTLLYILDESLQPVPVGVPGELHIGGVGLARGYLNRLDLTQEKFIPNPFRRSRGAGEQGRRGVKEDQSCSERLYKTGDLVRFLSDGNIEYLGRIDNQVKIRGFRIEVGEIEAVLSQHEHVQSTVVIAREDTPSNKRLVAYIVPYPQATPTSNEIRQFLKTKLPEYMVPSAIVLLESLPLTPNGKVDRRALPAPESRAGIEVTLVAPRTPIEERLASIWAQVLRVEPVGIHDNFFELGGDSILSIQIIAKAKQAGIELTLKQLFANQTIAQLATVADTTTSLSIAQGLVTGTFPLTPIQQWFFDQQFPQLHHFNQSFLLTVPSDINREILEQVWQELLKHHDALRLRFTQTQSNWQAIHAEPSSRQIVSCFDLRTLTHSEQTTAIENTANALQASLNLSDNLVCVALFQLGNNKQARLLIIIHHLVVDGVSWRILLEDLQTGYAQLSAGHAIQLSNKTTAFKDWAQRLREYAVSDRLTSELSYWLSASDSEFVSIPLDHINGENTVASAETISVSLNSNETQSLLQEVPKAYKTQINDVLLTALALVVSRWTDSKSVLFNLEGHGREDLFEGVDLSRTVGWLTAMFPVVLKLSAIELDNLGLVLKSVKEQLRAIPNKGIGYGLLRYLNQDAEINAQLATIPTPEISFNYLGQFTQVLKTGSLISPASESSGQFQSLQAQRTNLLDINAVIADEQLQINWTYSSNIHNHTTIEKLASEFVGTLQDIIAHCLEPENTGFTPSDFPLIKLNQSELDLVLARVALTSELGQKNWQNLEDIYPLSPMQAGMLFESLYAPDSGVYFEQITCTFMGLNVQAFEQAWQMVVARHSIFRTAFEWESLSTPVQVVYRQVQVTINTLDWRKLTKVEQQAQLETFLSSERQQGLQLSQAPLMRLHLLHLDENTYQFVWCHHHILLDGWSLPLVFQDLFKYYQALTDGVSLALQPTRSYRNYIAWLQQQDLDAAKEFWRQKLQGFSAPTPLTVDKPLSNQEHSGYSEQQIYFTSNVTAQAVDFVKQHQLTMNNLVQVAWGLLLSRYSSQTDVVFGATVSGRPPGLFGVESMVGLFINTVPVRLQIAETDLLSLLKELQAQQVESTQFSYCSLVEIQGLSDVPRGMSLFESIVVFENYPVDTDVLQDNSDLTVENYCGIEQTNYPLTVVVIPGEQLCLKLSYDTSRFEQGTINRMLGHFVTLLEAIVANPQQKINQLPLLTAPEQQQLLVEWNETSVDYPQDRCIHQLFEEQVALTPNAVAVVCEDQQLTYHQLNCRANQLAHYLQSLGVGEDVLVGICVERSIEMIVGLLGILKAGGAYVPLDPEYPSERLNFILEDAGVSVLLTQQHLVEKFPSLPAQVVCLDNWSLISQSQYNPITLVRATHLAYAIYTSGSTGTPKGVAIAHEGLLNLVFWHQRTFEITSSDKATQLAGTGFDAAVWEIWPYLTVGASIYLVKSELVTSPVHLQDWLIAHKITISFVPTPVAQELLSLEWNAQIALRYLLTGGDRLQRYPSALLPFQVVNNYGPTENTVVTTSGVVAQQLSQILPSIGRAIANTQLYILDPHLQPVPIGVPGELHIAGVGL
ncbi:hypothetical protein WA1_15530, partial [Scytonema hofmannii PCC 7110]